MMQRAKPEGMSETEWEALKNCPSGIYESALSLWQSMRSAKETEPEPPPVRHSAKIIQLPLWPEPQRASPNAFLRSAVFPAIQSKNSQYQKNVLIAAQGGYEIRFTGPQLDQADFDVWLQAAHFARCSPLGTQCTFTAKGFLKSIGRQKGGSGIDWLKGSLAKLQTSMVEIRFGKKWERINLLVRASGDDETTAICLKFDPLLIKLFAPDSWTALQWEERRKLKGKWLALWLHGYYSSHAAPYPVKVETLRDMCGSGTKNIRRFKTALKVAFEELERVTGISADFDGDLVKVNRRGSLAQARHLNRKKPRKPSR